MPYRKRKKLAILLSVLIPFVYFAFWIFIEIPPKVNPNIDYFITNELIEFSNGEVNKMWEAYEGSSFIKKFYFWKYLRARDTAILRYCLENGLGDNIGGGCYHFVGSYNSNDTFYALEYSGISWK
ncbi:MAG: hypothetical protein ACMUJM_25825 [bacterium]